MIEGKRVRLVPVETRHYDLVYRWACAEDIPWPWQGRPPSPEAFQETIWLGVLCQFVVEVSSDGRPIGFTSAYGANFHHQHCYVRLGFADSFQGRGWPMEAGHLMMKHLFDSYNFRKIYGEASTESMARIGLPEGTSCQVEGVFREHLFRSDGFQDSIVVAMHRADWEASMPRLHGHGSRTSDV